jgi:AcrR family transcriptional regulator
MEKESKGNQTKLKILECAAELFLKNGYTSTGIQDILVSTNLPKGSFYYHYKSKKELALCVCDFFEKRLSDMFQMAWGGNKSWPEFVGALCDQIEQQDKKREFFGCPLAVLGMETSLTEPEIAERCTLSLRRLCCVFDNILKKSGISDSKARELSFRCMACYEGFLTYYRVSWDQNALTEMRLALVDYYENSLNDGAKL